MGLGIILVANLFLIQVNSSNTKSVFESIRILSKDRVMRLVHIFIILGLLIIIYSPLNSILNLAPLSLIQLLFTIVLGGASVLWYEIVKFINRINPNL